MVAGKFMAKASVLPIGCGNLPLAWYEVACLQSDMADCERRKYAPGALRMIVRGPRESTRIHIQGQSVDVLASFGEN